MKRRPPKKSNAGCPRWILDGVKEIRRQVTTRQIVKDARTTATGDRSDET
ncbi:MAG: hypothetical protein WCP20_21475 [Desulfuromonadales bacterium]